MDLGAAPARHFETEADLDAFHRLYAHQSLGETAIELTVPLGVTAKPGRQAESDDLKYPSQGVAFLFTLLDEGDHFFFGTFVGCAYRRLFRTLVNFTVGLSL